MTRHFGRLKGNCEMVREKQKNNPNQTDPWLMFCVSDRGLVCELRFCFRYVIRLVWFQNRIPQGIMCVQKKNARKLDFLHFTKPSSEKQRQKPSPCTSSFCPLWFPWTVSWLVLINTIDFPCLFSTLKCTYALITVSGSALFGQKSSEAAISYSQHLQADGNLSIIDALDWSKPHRITKRSRYKPQGVTLLSLL